MPLIIAEWKADLERSPYAKKIVKFEIKENGAAIDAERMAKKGDLWHLLYDTRLEFRPVTKR
jgi:hypothetical protein